MVQTLIPREGPAKSTKKTSTSALVVFLSLLCSLNSSSRVAAISNDCDPGENEFEFYMVLDEYSHEQQGLSLVCDFLPVWEYEQGSIPIRTDKVDETNPYGFVRKTTCVGPESTCYFTITDSGTGTDVDSEGNVIADQGLHSPGWYQLKFGATTIADTKHVESIAFEYKTFCFGVECNSPPQEVENDCDYILLDLTLDGKPDEISVFVECDDIPVWTLADLTAPFATILRENCISHQSCCSFTAIDTGSDGLSSTSTADGSIVGSPGEMYLEWAYERILSYQGDMAMPFSNWSFQFGGGCSA